ncbi:MAG: M20 family metallo-hydrolase [Pseudomonadota bacterium]|jgi:succinyl-diaminopimelate desuccinylase|nr:M20 family metallo-hydrolase [Syntrophaceae bacterium]MBP7033154.1 M20 family metallo-hydrolase [Syntrophobacterales bacterium]MDI9555923.1 M20 family metallo-hydrolase [Pseudomonadota bacterium]NLX31119.1 M20 family metallo-hydrolase [Deltaproteobacteria bacterium]HNU85238.1 M20 family metallo-hydrolase [Syntrophales bacterium]
MIDGKVFERIRKRIEGYEPDMIRLQAGLTAIPALAPENGGDGEMKKAAFLVEALREMGFPAPEFCNAPDDRVSDGARPNVAVRVPGRRADRTVWVMTHTDVVPPGEMRLWEHDPYECRVRDGRVYGRGTEDNQQDLVASVFALKAFLDEGIVPESTAGILLAADEETGSGYGLDYVLENRRDWFRRDDLIVVPDAGNEEGSMIEVAEKSVLWLRVQVSGKQCHASRPALGKNAFRAASHLVVRLDGLAGVFDARDPLYDPPESTFEPTKKEANVPNVNTIPGEDVFFLDCRILPLYPVDDVLKTISGIADEIARTFGVAVDLSPVQKYDAPPATAHDAPVVRALEEAVRDVYGVRAQPRGVGGGTVAAVFRKYGYPAAVWSRYCHMAHQPNEYCLVENMVGNAKVYAHLFLQK